MHADRCVRTCERSSASLHSQVSVHWIFPEGSPGNNSAWIGIFIADEFDWTAGEPRPRYVRYRTLTSNRQVRRNACVMASCECRLGVPCLLVLVFHGRCQLEPSPPPHRRYHPPTTAAAAAAAMTTAHTDPRRVSSGALGAHAMHPDTDTLRAPTRTRVRRTHPNAPRHCHAHPNPPRAALTALGQPRAVFYRRARLGSHPKIS